MDNLLALLTLNKNEKSEESGESIKVISHQLNMTDLSQSLIYLQKLEIKHIIVNCALGNIKKFLNRALEMQLLTKDYHYHFTSLVSKAVNSDEIMAKMYQDHIMRS